MLPGKITDLIHLSLQSQLENAQLVQQHNDTGYGRLQGEDGTEVFFDYKAVDGCAFNELFEGQQVEFDLDGNAPGRAKYVAPRYNDARTGRSGVKNPPAGSAV